MGARAGFAAAALATALAMTITGSPASAVPVHTDVAFIVPGANFDAWAPDILEPTDPWATDGPLVPLINARYYDCAGCAGTVIRYPRTAGPLFGPGVPYADESIAIGARTVLDELAHVDGATVISALSLGALVSNAAQHALDADSHRPDASQISFIVAGDPSRATPLSTGIGSLMPAGLLLPVFGWTVTRPPSESLYDTVVVVGEYEWAADFPDRPWNLLADLNALVGFQYNHSEAALARPADIPPDNIVTTTNGTGATTTTYLVPSPQLPLLTPFDAILAPSVISAANDVLTPIVKRGYSRYDSITGNRMPYLEPTDGFPALVFPSDSPEPATATRDITETLSRTRARTTRPARAAAVSSTAPTVSGRGSKAAD
ncbi:PE-PPE domain-containing protein [Mycolicibacterium sp.]|uniref:PE-PPE domain-containing protein n=1 Tax=Mycolicibacterium sp. TaxID=2320850 RepID=UPI0028AE29C3|nr:PE-PPE domain-containing protein [Mycolicibacterium sp.]